VIEIQSIVWGRIGGGMCKNTGKWGKSCIEYLGKSVAIEDLRKAENESQKRIRGGGRCDEGEHLRETGCFAKCERPE